MKQQELLNYVKNMISDHRTGVLSTVENNKPHSRYMTFYHDNLTLYTPTGKETEKIEEIDKNPSVSILLGYVNEGQSDAYVQISGTATINQSPDIKERFWEESFNKWFDGPQDPNYAFIQIQPNTIRVLNIQGEPAQELTL